MFPSIISTYNIVNPSDRLNSPSHSALHNTTNSVLGQIQTVIGVEGASSVVGSLQYLIKSPASDGGGHVQTANKGGTGQTTYTKGDLLVGQSSSVLTKLAAGNDGLVLVADSTQSTGIRWGAGSSPTVRVYSVQSSVQTWVKPSTLSYVIVEVQGAGGGGGGTTTALAAKGGGGAGGYTRKMILAANLPAAASVLAGSGGPGGAGSSETNGVAGQSSFFASILSASGGAGSSGVVGGAGGVGTGGDFVCNGGAGFAADDADTNASNGGNGGNGILGGGAPGGTNGGEETGGNAGTFGGGGGGACSSGGADSQGGRGGQGVVIVTEY